VVWFGRPWLGEDTPAIHSFSFSELTLKVFEVNNVFWERLFLHYVAENV
jgi:hypothetical protein